MVIDLALEVDLLSDETMSRKASHLFSLTRESLKRRQIDELWKVKRATSPQSLAEVLISEAVVEEIRKELRRQTGQNVDSAELVRLLQEGVLKPDCLA